MEIEGIAITHVRLIATNTIFTFLTLALIVSMIFFAYVSYDSDTRKAKNRLRELSAKPNKGASTRRKIAKLQNRLAKEKKERRQDRWLYAICLPLIALMLVLFVIPGWMDYACKDYVVYEGTFSVNQGAKQKFLILEDGTRLLGGIGLQEGTYQGQIVYTKRTKIILGGDV